MSPILWLSGLLPARCLDPDLLESAFSVRCAFAKILLMPTICPAPTTPNLLTSAAAASLELVLKERLLALLANWVSGRLAKSGDDMLSCLIDSLSSQEKIMVRCKNSGKVEWWWSEQWNLVSCDVER